MNETKTENIYLTDKIFRKDFRRRAILSYKIFAKEIMIKVLYFDQLLVMVNMVKFRPTGILTFNSLIVMIFCGPMGGLMSYFITVPLSYLSPRALKVKVVQNTLFWIANIGPDQ